MYQQQPPPPQPGGEGYYNYNNNNNNNEIQGGNGYYQQQQPQQVPSGYTASSQSPDQQNAGSVFSYQQYPQPSGMQQQQQQQQQQQPPNNYSDINALSPTSVSYDVSDTNNDKKPSPPAPLAPPPAQQQQSPQRQHDGIPEKLLSLTSSRKNTGSLRLAVRDLTYSIQMPKAKGEKVGKSKIILNNINLEFSAGKLTVLMGSSGAGKTSLMSTLSGDLDLGVVDGSIELNGVYASASHLKEISAYVFQDDVIFPTTTVREAITMSAKLRLPATMPMADKLQRVEETIQVLRLTDCANAMIGNASMKGVSGGERKRCSVAMELVTDPPLLFLDEPTSGLDSFTALSLVGTLKALARKGRTVVCTMHQPSSEIFHLFDDLVILGKGEVIYAGAAADSVEYFASIGYPCPRYTNPADYFFTSVINDELGKVSMEERNMELVGHWKKKEALALAARQQQPPVALVEEEAFVHEEAHTGFFYQFALMLSRQAKNQVRNRLLLRARTGQTIMMAVIVGLTYLQLGTDQPTIQDREGFLFFIATNTVMSGALGVVSTYHGERPVFIREYRMKMYSLPAYYSAKVLTELPSLIILPFVFVTIMYWMVGLQANAGKYFTAYLIGAFLSATGNAIGVFVASIFTDPTHSLQVLPLFLLPLMLFSGFMINNDTIPPYFNWIKYLSPMKYGFTALIKNEFYGLKLTCGGASSCPYNTGEQVIEVMGMSNELTIAENVIIMGCIFVALTIMGFLALWRIGSRRSQATYITPGSHQRQHLHHQQQPQSQAISPDKQV